MSKLRILAVVLALAPGLRALDVQTLDGKTYRDCTVSLVEPDAVCLLFPGGGARVKFVNLPENLHVAYGYDPVKAAAFEQVQAAKRQREDARWQLARIQADAQRKAVASNALARAHSAAAPSARELAAYGGRNQGRGGYGGSGGNGQNSNSGTGVEYVGVNLASAGNSFSGGGGGGGGYGGGGAGGRNQGGWGGTGATYVGVRLVP